MDILETPTSSDDGSATTIGVLAERHREVLRPRFDEDLIQSDIAARIGVSQMQVSRILRTALQRVQVAPGNQLNSPSSSRGSRMPIRNGGGPSSADDGSRARPTRRATSSPLCEG